MHQSVPFETTIDRVFFLSNQIGKRECHGCRGKVRLKTYSCLHELHNETTLRECRRCPDYDERLEVGRVQKWSVGVTTAPRKSPTIDQSIKSLAYAGWENPHIFAEPDSILPKNIEAERITIRTQKLGAWPNWLLSLNEMFLRNPHADAYLICQDDVLYSHGLRGLSGRIPVACGAPWGGVVAHC